MPFPSLPPSLQRLKKADFLCFFSPLSLFFSLSPASASPPTPGLPRHRLPHGRRRRCQAPPAHDSRIRRGPCPRGRAAVGAQPPARRPLRGGLCRARPPRARLGTLRRGLAGAPPGAGGRVRPAAGASGRGDYEPGPVGARLPALAGEKESAEREERRRGGGESKKKESERRRKKADPPFFPLRFPLRSPPSPPPPSEIAYYRAWSIATSKPQTSSSAPQAW